MSQCHHHFFPPSDETEADRVHQVSQSKKKAATLKKNSIRPWGRIHRWQLSESAAGETECSIRAEDDVDALVSYMWPLFNGHIHRPVQTHR